MPSHRDKPVHGDTREGGIALLVVMIVFVVLYLVVYQLHFSTSMEERIAEARYGDVENSVAVQSVALFVITHLIEDLKKDMSGTNGGSGAAGADRGAPTGKDATGVRRAGAADAKDEGVGGSFSSLQGAAGSTVSKPHDSLYENIFNENRQQIGQNTVKITITDGERKFDLNHLFDYVRLEGDEVPENADGGDANLSEDELKSAVDGKSGEDAAMSLRDKILQRNKEKKSKSTAAAAAGAAAKKTTGPTSKSKDGTGVARVEDEEAAAAAGTEPVSEYEEDVFTPPEPERVQATKEMLAHALEMVFTINEFDYGYRYARKYDAQGMAQRIVEYVLERRQAAYQSRIYLVTELLNLNSGGLSTDITPEVFYGPWPQLAEGETFQAVDGFELRRDEFGDLVPVYTACEVDEASKAEEKQMLEDLQKQWGQFADFGGLGLGRLMENPLTRGMQELPIDVDQDGNEYVLEAPRPIGLKDIFTTFSTGQININTAPVPVLFGLLRQSSSEEEAKIVASLMRDWRQHYRVEEDEQGTQAGVKRVSDDKDPSGKSRKDRTARGSRTQPGAGAAGAAGADALAGLAGSVPGLDPSMLGEMGSSYQDLDLNYFTTLEDIAKVDGFEDGSARDILSTKTGVERVSKEDDTLFRRVKKDLQKVATYGSTYFSAELKSKPKEGRAVKTGQLTVRRGVKERMVEVVLWKNFQK